MSTTEVTGPTPDPDGAVDSVNGRTGDVVGLAEQAALTAEVEARQQGDDDAIASAAGYTDDGLAGHVAAPDPHPGYLTEAAANATYTSLLAHGSTVGVASLVGSDLVIDVATPWGIGVDGPYYDPGAVTPGEEALFSIDPDGVAGWVLLSEVH